MPLGIITKNTPANGWPLTFPKVAQVWNSAPWISYGPDTHTEKSASWLIAFRNYYKKHTQKADLLPSQR